MQIKEWLNRGRECNNLINSLQADKDAMRRLVYSDLDCDYKNIMQKYINYENRIHREIDRLIDIKSEIFDVIHRIDDKRLRQVLQLRYLCMVDTWDEIADRMYTSTRWIHGRLHPQALAEAQKIRENI